MEGLPKLPGNSFTDPTKTRFHISQTLSYKNGHQMPLPYPTIGIGGTVIKPNQLTEEDLDQLANFQPTLTYGKSRQAPPVDFIPSYVAFDKKVLRFWGYYKETVNESPIEHFRIHHIKLYYYLEDDSTEIIESKREDLGGPHGTIVVRQKLPKNEVGDHYSWKDLNVGFNICAYGVVYRLTSCDKYTQRFLESEGVKLNEFEERPEDPYLGKRIEALKLPQMKAPSAFDDRKQFLELDKKVLRFYCIWDDREEMFGECRKFILHYYLADDTMEIAECRKLNQGYDPFPLLVKRHKVPKDMFDVKPSHPHIFMELSSNEIKEYFTPRDLQIGETILVYNRRFLIYDCDNFTKAWYYQHLGITDFTPVEVDFSPHPPPKLDIPEYNKYGSLEDSLGTYFSVVPKAPERDWVKYLENSGKTLRYLLDIESKRPEDMGRDFIMTYRLADDMITVYETSKRNSGRMGGLFLNPSRIAKPGSSCDRPIFYGPQDFFIGARLEFFSYKFVIKDVDAYAVKWIEAHRELFPAALVESLRQKLNDSNIRDKTKRGLINVTRKQGDLDSLIDHIKMQLKKFSYTDMVRVDRLFLRYNKDRQNNLSKQDLAYMLRKMNLPSDDDIIDRIFQDHGSNGNMGLEEFRKFFENS